MEQASPKAQVLMILYKRRGDRSVIFMDSIAEALKHQDNLVCIGDPECYRAYRRIVLEASAGGHRMIVYDSYRDGKFPFRALLS